jgi:hypothetical protein
MSFLELRTRATARLAALTLVLLMTSALIAAPAEAAIDAQAEQQFACLVNAERAKVGRPALRIATDLRSVARSHSVVMADANHLHHNPNLASQVKNWSVLAENVGRGSSVTALHSALMNSDGHRRNILDERVTELGVGVEVRGSTVWVTQVFRRPSGSNSGSVPNCVSDSTVANTPVPAGGIPVSGDWNGDGRSTPGVFLNGRWYLSNGLNGGADIVFDYGMRGDLPIVGDWNANGRDTIGVVRDRGWHLRNQLSGGAADLSFTYGRVTRGDIPITGDWNGNGRSGIGIIRDGEWHLRNSLSGGHSQISFVYGRITRGDVPLVGDWNANGRDTIGIVRDGEWHLRNALSGGQGQLVFTYGRVLQGDHPVIGDWNRNGRSGIGIVRQSDWHLRNSLSGGPAQILFKYA